MARFFIDRPVFAWVIAIIIMLTGLLSISSLPVEQYPEIAPPTISISADYPGASARVLEDSVTQVIEQQITGLDGLRYMSSTSSSTGSVRISLTFEPGVDPDIAQVQVQNKLQAALPLLPQEVQQRGVRVTKSSSSFLMVVGFVAKDDRLAAGDISDYIATTLQDPVSRIDGVGEVMVFGPKKAMRIWLDPLKLKSLGITTSDVVRAIQTENTQISAGQLGGLPSVSGQQLNVTVTAQTKMQTVAEFENILLRVGRDGSQVRLKDVARVELGYDSYNFTARYNGKPSAGLGIRLASGANALTTARLIKEKISEVEPFMPEGVEVFYPFDTSPFIRLSIKEVLKTLAEAVLLVFVIMYLFLGSIRATLVPTVAIPVVLLGTLAILQAFGFSINSLTMFAMILAIGLLVDDAIVVVENVERVMEEEGLSPREATRKSMGQITGALIGIGVVLSAVFVPMAFFGGAAGAIYQQFSVTIISAMALSVLVALVLSPAMCATILKPRGHAGESGVLLMRWFNRSFRSATEGYRTGLQRSLGRLRHYGVAYLLIMGGLFYIFGQLPGSFLPQEDQGQLFVLWNTPPGTSMERTLETTAAIEEYFLTKETDSVEGLMTITGFSFAGRGQNSGMAFVRLKDWAERGGSHLKPDAIAGRAMAALGALPDAQVFTIQPPAIPGLGAVNGFDMQLVDVGGIGHKKLLEARNSLLGMAAAHPLLIGVRPNGMEDTVEYRIDVDREKAQSLGVSIADINETLSTAWGGSYVNDFIDRGRIKRVYVQGDLPHRMMPDDLGRWHVRNRDGSMVPFAAFASGSWSYGSPQLERYNGNPSMNIQGSAVPGVSSGVAMQIMEDLVAKLPYGVSLEWTGMSYEEKLSGNQAPFLYALSLLVIFLCLAALYESWSIPFAVIVAVPLGVVGAVTAAMLGGLSADIFFQVALLTTVGLTARNAILIVEFARNLSREGKSLLEATVEASRQRFRPIIMTSMAFSMGVLPMAVASGPGAESQNAIGIGVLGGMLSAMVFSVFFVPALYIIVSRMAGVAGRPGWAEC